MRIPEEHRQQFFAVAKLSKEAIAELYSILDSIPPAIQHQDAVMNALKNTKQISPNEARAIVSVLLTAYSVLEFSGKPINIFMEELIESIYEKDEASNNEKKLLNENLSRLLSVPAIRLISKATRVAFDCDNILKQARILTDIRPVFGNDTNDSILGSVIIQTLKLEYFKDDEEKEFYVNLDDQDIDNLIALLTRAKRKAEQSKNLLHDANVTYIPMVKK